MSSQQPTPVLCLGVWSLSLSTWTWVQECKTVLCWKVLLSSDLCGWFSPFCLLSTCCCTALWGSEGPPVPTLEWGKAEGFHPSGLPPPGTGHVLKLFVSSFIFHPTSFWGDWLAFLEVWGLLSVLRGVLEELFNMKMNFWCFCGEIIYLCHLEGPSIDFLKSFHKIFFIIIIYLFFCH